jgi:hypothetical protein
MSTIVETRVVSGFPVSIGTSLALESMFEPVQKPFDSSREIPNLIDLGTYDLVMFNAATLVRNLLAAVPSGEMMSYSLDEYEDVLLDEIQYMDGLFALLDTQLQVYTCDYSKAYSGVPQERIRVPSTPRQEFSASVIQKITNTLGKADDVLKFGDRLLVPPPGATLGMNTILVSHIPWDLLSFKQFKKLELLETHTGKLKSRSEWYTKYFETPGADMSFLPLSAKLLPVFGDSVMFKPDNVGYRRRLLAKLQEGGVTPVTNDGTITILKAKVPRTDK